MYPSPEARASDIATGAQQSPVQLRAEAHEASGRLEDAVASMPLEAWAATVTTSRKLVIPAEGVPWLRIRETWVHAVDLAGTATFQQLPPEVTTALLEERISDLEDSTGAFSIVATDLDRRWSIGAPADQQSVLGSAADLVGWLLGRTGGAGLDTDAPGGDVPVPPRWM
jgi:maleylpyruvate isomerase